MRSSAKHLWSDQSGAIAAVYALALPALIVCGGIAFDYARLAAMDTELQNAADQAALAAVTQLDQSATACARASSAAVSLVANTTLFANETSSRAVTITGVTDCAFAAGEKIRFWQDKAKTTAATTDANARFVEVTVDARTAEYALTPIVGLFNSGAIAATAMAGLGSAICKVPPVMICNPDEPVGNTNVDYPFDANALRGYGLKLISVGNGPSAWAPGNFGYLDTGSSTSNPNVELREALGWTTAPGNCSPLGGVRTRTGAGTPVTQALNTRFDIYEKANTGNGNAASCPTGGACPPSINTVKDVFQRGTPNAANKCGVANNEWELPSDAEAYRPTDTTDLTQAQADAIRIMGHPRDKCHAVSINGVCTYGGGTETKIGNGAWDRNAYFRVNYGWTSTDWPTYLNQGVVSARIATSTPTRYEVYNWEIANRGASIGGRTILGSRTWGSGGNPPTDFDQPVCSALQTPSTSGIVPEGANVDRRRISAAVINCDARDVNGGGPTAYTVLKWIELFIVEPSLNRGSGGSQRTDPNDVYVEIIGETQLVGAGATAGQVVRRDVPYLIE
jgi:Flp pilus assembly protein TadG